MSPKPRRDYVSLYVRLSEAEKEKLKQRAAETGYTLSDLVDQAVRLFLRATKGAETGVVIPPPGQLMLSRYNIDPSTSSMLNEAVERHNYAKQDIVRAAVARFIAKF